MAAAEEINIDTQLDSQDELTQKFKQLPLLSNFIINDKVNIDDNEGYLFINDFTKFNNLYYYLQTGQTLLTMKEMLSFRDTNSFTYMLFQINNTNTGEIKYEFRARPVYSKFESFAKHQTIYLVMLYELFGIDIALDAYQNIIYGDLYEKLGVVSAGEVIVRTQNYFEFNFSSGTYMMERLTLHRNYDKDAELSRQYAVQFEGIVKEHIYNERDIKIHYLNDAGKTMLINNDVIMDLKLIWVKINENKTSDDEETIYIYLMKNQLNFLMLRNKQVIFSNFISNLNKTIRILSLSNSELKKNKLFIKNIKDLNDELIMEKLKKYDILNINFKGEKKKKIIMPNDNQIRLNMLPNEQYYNMILKIRKLLNNTSLMIYGK